MDIKKYTLTLVVVLFCKINLANALIADMAFDKTCPDSCHAFLGQAITERILSITQDSQQADPDPTTLQDLASKYKTSEDSPIPKGQTGISHGKNLPVFISVLCEITKNLNLISQECKRNGTKLKVMEIACGCGNLSQLLPWLVDADFTFVDCNQNALNRCNECIQQTLQALGHKCNTDFHCADCNELPTRFPELREHFDCVIALNLQHFFGPKKDKEFYRCLSFLMKPKARAILTAQNVISTKDDHLFSFVKAQEKTGVPYPGFVNYSCYAYQPLKHKLTSGVITFELIKDTFMYGSTIRSLSHRPKEKENFTLRQGPSEKEDEDCVTVMESSETQTYNRIYLCQRSDKHWITCLTKSSIPKTPAEMQNMFKLPETKFFFEFILQVTYNHFSPDVYRKAIAFEQKITHLKLIDTFSIDQTTGLLSSTAERQHFTCAIVEKHL